MNTATRKQKGRRFQQKIAKDLNGVMPHGKFSSTSMGRAGTDIQDPNNFLPWGYTECKNWEKWPTLDEVDAMVRQKGDSTVVLFSRNRRADPLAILPWSVLLNLLGGRL